MSVGVYSILNTITDTRYIGRSTDIEARWRWHRHNIRHRIHTNLHLQNAWYKYGKDAFEFSVLLICERFELREYERAILVLYTGSQELYNNKIPKQRLPKLSKSEMAARTLAIQRSPENRAKISAATKAAMTLEVRERMSRKSSRCVPCTVDGIHYYSLTAAAKALDVGWREIRRLVD